MYADFQKRHQPIAALEPVTDQTTDRSGNADEDDPAERGCSRLKKTVGLTSTTPGGSRLTASLGERYDPSPVKRSNEWGSEYKVKNRVMGYRAEQEYDDIFSRVDTIQQRDRRTDRRTDGRTPNDSKDRAMQSVVRVKNENIILRKLY